MKRNAIFTIFKKELVRFFTDRRTLVALILPGILLYTIYSLMGGAMSNLFMPDEEYKPTIYSVNTPTSLGSLFDAAELELIDKISL
jgi:sodium transport system permease protein